MTNRHVLVVDDDRDVAEAVADLLRFHGHTVDIAYLGKPAVLAATNTAYDAVLVDIGLPDLDGTKVLREIERIRPSVQGFLMTGYSSQDIASRAQRAEHEILVKPFDTAELVRKIEAGNG